MHRAAGDSAVPAPHGRWLVMQVHGSLIELFGNTPLVRLHRVTRD